MRLASALDGVFLALDQLRANRFRSALTILGIVIGVATVMAMSGMVVGVRSSAMEGIQAAGPRNFILARFDFTEVRVVNGGVPWGDNPPVSIEEARRIERLDLVRRAIVDIDLNVAMEAGNERVENVAVSANSTGWAEFTTGQMIAGRDFLAADVQAARPVMVVSKQLAEALFGQLDPVGRSVRVSGFPFQITGVFDPAGNIFADMMKYIAVVPYTAAIKYLEANEQMLSVLVVTAAHATQEAAMDQVIATMRTMRGLRPGEPNDFALMRQEELAAMFDRFTAVFFAVMIALSSVALMVGGVGVIAIMMIAVTERTREIGVRKALGATRREILWQFLFEAATLTLLGAAFGLLLGGSASLLVQTLTPIPARIPLPAVVAALVTAGAAGMVFGLWPAWRAARMDPVAALRHP